MKVHASAKHIRISPRKVRVVVNSLVGLGADDALNKLRFIRKKAVGPVFKLLGSAIANAEHNFYLDKNTLKITSMKVDEGPTLKRYKAKGFGRAALINRRSSHISIVLEGQRLSKEAVSKDGKKEVKPEPKLENKEVKTMESPSKKDFEVEKKVGKERKPSFVKKMFRRKSI